MRMGMRLSRGLAGVLCATAVALGAGSPAAHAASDDPLLVFTAASEVPPGTGFNGPCGLAVDTVGNLYVSDYYHHTVDVFSTTFSMPVYWTQLKEVDPLDGPCGLAVGPSGHLFINAYHRNIVRYTPSGFPPTTGTTYGSALTFDSQHPTGVAVDPASGNVYANDRTHLTAYSSAGAVLEEIGVGDLGDGYGLAFSQFPATAGHLYVADAATDTVKAYEPLTSTTVPVAAIAGPPGGFTSLKDSAIAVDRSSGDVYVADRRSSPLTERPESTIQVFDSTGAYEGHLKYNVIDASPVGLAVDNSLGARQGQVYVTSGNTVGASVIAYPPGAATTAPMLPALLSTPALSESGAAKTAKALPGAQEHGSSSTTASASEVSQEGNLLISVSGEVAPRKLPRRGAAPIAVSVGWKIASSDDVPVPKLKKLKIEINRAGRFDLAGLPTCPYSKIQPATTQRALANCRSALVGRGSFSALISLEGQESYVTRGQMLVFNSLRGGSPVLYGQIYAARPFASSFVIPFLLQGISKGRYGNSLTATLPASLRAWGSLTEIQMRLGRNFAYRGKRHSFLSAGCAAPEGFAEALFPLARTSFEFEGGLQRSLVLNRSCRARG